MKDKPFEIPKLIIVKPMKNRLKEDRVVWPHYDEYSDPRGFHADYIGDFFFMTNEPKMNPDGSIKEEQYENTLNYLRVAYICDHKFCKECNNPDCHHVCDIAHAKNFECISENEYWEKEET